MNSISASIARKDRLTLLRDNRLRWALLLVLLLSLASVAATYVQFAQASRDRHMAATVERDNWLHQGESNPHFAAHFGEWVFRPMEGMPLLEPGAVPHAGVAIWLEAHTSNPAAFRAAEERMGTLDLGTLSASWVLQTLGPLLAFLLAAGLVAHERESGTLRLLLASGATAMQVVTAKTRGLMTTLLFIVVPVLFTAAGALALLPAAPLGDMLARALLWALLHALWLGWAVLLGMAVSARAASTQRALMLLIALWVIVVVLTPRAAASIAQVLHPTPTGAQFMAQVEKDIQGGVGDIPGYADNEAQLRQELLRQYQVQRVEDLPVSWMGAMLEAGEVHGAKVYAYHYAQLHDIYAAQRRSMRIAALLSPLIAVQNLSSAWAGTDNFHLRAFEEQAEAQRLHTALTLNGDFKNHGAGIAMYKAGADLWQQIEAFRFQPVPVGQTWRNTWPDALILLVWLAIAALLLRTSSQHVLQGEAA